MIPLLLGTLIAIGALAFVLAPLFRESAVPATPDAARGGADSRREPSARERAIEALREIEFDRATGKLSDDDYAELKAIYTRQALEAMRAEAREAPATAGVAASPADDELEAKILQYRRRATECPACGPRPEPDAAYCSNCGRYLAGQCGTCGAAVTEPGARYCTGCGADLAA